MNKILLFSFGLITVFSQALAQETLTYPQIVERLYKVKYLSTPPVVGEQSGLVSSWDRGAKYDEKKGKYVNWHANRDGDANGLTYREGYLIKMDGPGVIWRVWAALAQKGEVAFYIDGAEKPVYTTPFVELFNNKKAPFDYSELNGHLGEKKSRGYNFFVPITFQKSIEIRAPRGWGKYYQITYSKFPPGTKIPSFKGSFSDEDKAALNKANDVWAKRGPQIYVTDKSKVKKASIKLAPGEEKEVASFSEAAAITSIVVDRLKMDRKASVKILRELTLSITWDDDKKASVWTPLGDFFGTGAGENLYRLLMTGMTKENYYSNWYMPFKKARIVASNDGSEARQLDFTIHTEAVKGDVDKLLRFHMKWQRDNFSGFDKEQLLDERWPDWPVVKVDGSAGRFCGFVAHMWNPNHNWNRECSKKFAKFIPKKPIFQPGGRLHRTYARGVARDGWWGEGDEKFFVDGEKMPSTFGTGTEDYFGYAWGAALAFDSALQAQPRNGAADEIGKEADRRGPGNIGHISNVRWQLADNVPFQKSFEAVIEKYHPNEWPLLNAYTVVWYQTAGKEDYYGVVPVKERSDYFIPATLKKDVEVQEKTP